MNFDENDEYDIFSILQENNYTFANSIIIFLHNLNIIKSSSNPNICNCYIHKCISCKNIPYNNKLCKNCYIDLCDECFHVCNNLIFPYICEIWNVVPILKETCNNILQCYDQTFIHKNICINCSTILEHIFKLKHHIIATQLLADIGFNKCSMTNDDIHILSQTIIKIKPTQQTNLSIQDLIQKKLIFKIHSFNNSNSNSSNSSNYSSPLSSPTLSPISSPIFSPISPNTYSHSHTQIHIQQQKTTLTESYIYNKYFSYINIKQITFPKNQTSINIKK